MGMLFAAFMAEFLGKGLGMRALPMPGRLQITTFIYTHGNRFFFKQFALEIEVVKLMVNQLRYMGNVCDANRVTDALVNNVDGATKGAQRIILAKLIKMKHHGAVARIINNENFRVLDSEVQKKARELNYHFLLANSKQELPPALNWKERKILRA